MHINGYIYKYPLRKEEEWLVSALVVSLDFCFRVTSRQRRRKRERSATASWTSVSDFDD